MTSQINPADIDGNYPIAGVSNNTQGMRDNFTNTRTNFQYASDEITDLQNNVVLKAALLGTTLDNNLGNNVVYNALVKGISGTVVAIANTSGTITIDCSAGPYQSINMAGNIALSFTSNTWPTAGTLGMLRTQITVDQAGRTLTLPGTVSNGIVGIQGYASNVITFANTGTYEFGFSTTNAGNAITIVDLNRPLNYYTNNLNIAANTVSTSATTGALIVAGGVGVQGNLYVNGDIFGNVTVTDIAVNTVTAVGNIIGGNLKTAGLISATGNVNGGNIIASGLISVAGNIAGAYFIGDGGYLSNVTAVSNVAATQIANGTTNLSVQGPGGNVTVTIGGTSNVAVFNSTGANITGTATATGNIQGGNLRTAGQISATANVTGGNINTAGVVTATGNITGGNLVTSGSISAASVSVSGVTISVANITGGNLLTSGLLSATGNITSTANIIGGNILTVGLMSSTGNVTGGNLTTGAQVVATGNITGGNLTTGAQVVATGNISGGNVITANVFSTTHTGTTVSVTGNITGGNINTVGVVTATANITGGNVLSEGVLSVLGNARILSGVSTPAGGTAGKGYMFSNVANLGVFFGLGVPTLSAAQGSLYLRTDGGTTTNRMYINTDGATTWTSVITVA